MNAIGRPDRMFELIKANEEAPGFDLGAWVAQDAIFQGGEHPCGTFGCLIGNYGLAKGLVSHRRGLSCFRGVPLGYDEAAAEFGITSLEAEWLFSPYNFARGENGICFYHNPDPQPVVLYATPRDEKDLDAALRRVRKFLYYKLHKKEMLYEEDGRVKESARRTEGDRHVCRKVLEKV